MDFISSFFILFSALYFQTVQTDPALSDCGKDGRESVAQTYCSDGHNIVMWKMGAENFEKFHRFPTENVAEREHLEEVRNRWWPDGPPTFVYESNTQNEEDLERWNSDCLTWGPYVDIPKQAEIEYGADIFAAIPRSSWSAKYKEGPLQDKTWPDATVMFQIELYADGKILDKVVMNWEKYYRGHFSSSIFGIINSEPILSFISSILFLNRDGIIKSSSSAGSGGFSRLRATYRSTHALKNVEVRICNFYPYHSLFAIKETSLKATYK